MSFLPAKADYLKKRIDSLYKLSNSHLLFIGILVYLVSRLLFIDSDLPLWKVLNYQPIDEFYYCINGFNLFENHSYFSIDGDITTGYIQNLVVYFTLKIFGDNYYGLRMGSVITGGLIIWLIYVITNQLYKSIYGSGNRNKWLNIILILYLITEFHFYVASKVFEPTIYRLLIMLLIIYYLIKANYQNLRITSLLGGAFSTAGFLFVYPTNFFLVPASFFYLIYIFKSKQLQSFFWFSLGTFIAITIYFLILSIFFKINMQAWIESLQYFNNEYSNRVAFSFSSLLLNIKGFLSISIFQNNLSLAILFIFSVPFYLKLVWTNSNKTLKILLIFFILFVLQSIFINDVPLKKLIILLPFLIIPIFLFLNHLVQNRFDLRTIYPSIRLRILLLGISVAYIIGLISVFREIGGATRLIIITLNSLSILFIGILFKKPTSFIFLSRKLQILVLMFAFIFPSSFLSFKYIVKSTYFYRDAMKSLNNIAGDNKMLGGWSYGFRLYNSADVGINLYLFTNRSKGRLYIEELKELVNNELIDYSIMYEEDVEYLKHRGINSFKVIKQLIPSEQECTNTRIFLIKFLY